MTTATAKTLAEVSSPNTKLRWLRKAAPRTARGKAVLYVQYSNLKDTSQVGRLPLRTVLGEGFAETREILADSVLMTSIRRGLADADEGRLFTTDEIRATLDL